MKMNNEFIAALRSNDNTFVIALWLQFMQETNQYDSFITMLIDILNSKDEFGYKLIKLIRQVDIFDTKMFIQENNKLSDNEEIEYQKLKEKRRALLRKNNNDYSDPEYKKLIKLSKVLFDKRINYKPINSKYLEGILYHCLNTMSSDNLKEFEVICRKFLINDNEQ